MPARSRNLYSRTCECGSELYPKMIVVSTYFFLNDVFAPTMTNIYRLAVPINTRVTLSHPVQLLPINHTICNKELCNVAVYAPSLLEVDCNAIQYTAAIAMYSRLYAG